jgi:hypothetical protein
MSEHDTDLNGADQTGGEGAGDADGFIMEQPKARNNGFLVLLALVVLGGAGVYVMKMRATPQAAKASAEVKKANETIDKFLSDSSKSGNSMKDLLKGTEKVVAMFLNYANTPQIKLDDLKANPFQATAEDPEAEAKRAAALREKEKKAIAEEASNLRINSIFGSARVKTCIINNRAYTIGNEVEGFVIEKIDAASVTVSKRGITLELTMSSK